MRTFSEPKRKPGREGWWVRAYDDEAQRATWLKLKGARTLLDARKRAEELRKAPRSQRQDFGGALEEWIGFYTGTRQISERTISDNYDPIFARWRKRWGVRLVSSITLRDVERYHTELGQKGYGARTRNTERALLRSFFRWAVSHELAAKDPTATLPHLDDSPARPGRVLTEEELQRLLAACQETREIECRGLRNTGGRGGGKRTGKPVAWTQRQAPPPWLHPLVLVGARTLLRLGTLRRLRWDHVDLENRVLRLPGAVMKARDPIEIPLSPDALAVLRDLHVKAESLLVFPNVPQGPGVARALTSAAKAAGLSGPVGFHALRRSGATILRQQGVPLEVVMALGAWRSPEVLLKHYRKVTPEEVQKATRILDSAAHSKSQGRTQES